MLQQRHKREDGLRLPQEPGTAKFAVFLDMAIKKWSVDPKLSFRDLMEKLKDLTPSQIAIALFLAVREMESGPATLKEIQKELGFSSRTIDGAMPLLRLHKIIVEG